MDNLNKEIGQRLREIRHIANEGDKLSARQFAHVLGETADKILNYENGRAAVTPHILVNLFRRGFSPVFILTGEGDIHIDQKPKSTGSVEIIGGISSGSLSDLLKQAEHHSAAAGDILKAIQSKANNND